MSQDLQITDSNFEPEEIRVREWVRRKLGSIAHESRVMRAADMFFKLTQRWHGLGRNETKLLRLAALVHDVGRAEDVKEHEKIGARMVMDNILLPLSANQRRRLAFLTRYHRGRVPQIGEERYLDHETDNRQTMRILLGLLRAADAVDSRSLSGPQLVGTVQGKMVNVYGYITGDVATAAAILGKPKKFRLLESTLGCEVRTEWFAMDRLALVS